MRKNHHPQSGIFNPRVLLAFAFCFVGAFLGLLSFAASPSSGMMASDANSPPVDSFLLDKNAGRSSGLATAPLASAPLAATPGGWALITSPNTDPAQYNQLNGIACPSASDCWAVGYFYNGSHSQTLI